MKIIDTKLIMEREKKKIKEELESLKITPKFTILSVGNDKSNEKYVTNKIRHCEDVGIMVSHVNLSNNTTEKELIDTLIELQKNCDSIILQLPLDTNNKIDTNKVINYIDYLKDVDGLTTINQGRLFTGKPILTPATPLAVMKFLEEINYNLEGKNVLVNGRSNLLGKPLGQLLLNANATVTMAHSKSDVNIEMMLGYYDVVISCVGKAHEFKNIQTDVIIDCGINFKEGKMIGDVDINTCKYDYATIPPCKKEGIYAGIGTLTCLMLLKNIITSCKLQKKQIIKGRN